MATTITIPTPVGLPGSTDAKLHTYRVEGEAAEWIHTSDVYNTLIDAAHTMEDRLAESLKLYKEHPDVQANLQQLQYDLQMWNLALTTMTNIQKNMADALNSIASNFR